jgi:TonB family protein
MRKRTLQNVSVPLLSHQEIARLTRNRVKVKRAPEKKEENSKDLKNKQIVDIPPPKIEKVPTKSRFLAEFNSKVREEMVHRNRQVPQAKMVKSDRRSHTAGDDLRGSRRGKRGVMRKTRNDRPAQKVVPPSPRSRGAKVKSERGVQKRADLKKQKIVRGEGPFKQADSSQDQRQSVKRGDPQSEMKSHGKNRLAPTHLRSLLPTLGPQDQIRQDGSIDHVPQVKRGHQTMLNTNEYRYAVFFNRVKRAVGSQWSPQSELRRLDPTGRVLGVEDRKTILSITLSREGSIIDIKIIQPSGVYQLDQVAINAFTKAQPFHNPPSGLADPDGMIRFKFGFYLEFNARELKLFR